MLTFTVRSTLMRSPDSFLRISVTTLTCQKNTRNKRMNFQENQQNDPQQRLAVFPTGDLPRLLTSSPPPSGGPPKRRPRRTHPSQKLPLLTAQLHLAHLFAAIRRLRDDAFGLEVLLIDGGLAAGLIGPRRHGSSRALALSSPTQHDDAALFRLVLEAATLTKGRHFT
jgi:hypothetical protein